MLGRGGFEGIGGFWCWIANDAVRRSLFSSCYDRVSGVSDYCCLLAIVSIALITHCKFSGSFLGFVCRVSGFWGFLQISSAENLEALELRSDSALPSGIIRRRSWYLQIHSRVFRVPHNV